MLLLALGLGVWLRIVELGVGDDLPRLTFSLRSVDPVIFLAILMHVAKRVARRDLHPGASGVVAEVDSRIDLLLGLT